MSVFIENYRGHDIVFMPDSERFSFEADTGSWQTKQSFASAKKAIDDYVKNNQEFKPFKIVKTGYKGVEILKVTGIRKDNRLMVEHPNGKIEQLGEYNESDYCIYDEKNAHIYKQIEEHELGTELIKNEREAELKRIKKGISAIPLKDYKKKIIVP